MNKLSPNLFVKNMEASLQFYAALGFKTAMSVPEDNGGIRWAMMSNGNVEIMLQTMESLGSDLPQISRQPGGSLLLYIELNDVRGLFEKLQGNTAVLTGLEKTFYGALEFSVTDPDGFVITFAKQGE